MKVGRLKPVVRDNRIVFETVAVAHDKKFSEIDGISPRLQRLNVERYLIRRSKSPKPLLVKQESVLVGKKRG